MSEQLRGPEKTESNSHKIAGAANKLTSKLAETAKIDLPQEPREDRFTRSIEEQTGKIPSTGFLALAVGSIGLSVILEITLKKKEIGNFVGLWAPTFLLFGIYNKLVKMEYEHFSPKKSA